MKYSDEQRLKKIYATTGKLIRFLKDENITAETVLAREPMRWAITTPLYNIGEQAYNLSDGFKEQHMIFPGPKYPVYAIGWYTTMTTQTGL